MHFTRLQRQSVGEQTIHWSLHSQREKVFFISKGITSSCQGGEWEHWHKLQQHPDFRHGVSGRLTQDAALPCPALFPWTADIDRDWTGLTLAEVQYLRKDQRTPWSKKVTDELKATQALSLSIFISQMIYRPLAFKNKLQEDGVIWKRTESIFMSLL